MSLRVGLIGCGVISDIYLRNAPLFPSFDIVCCADARPEAASTCAARYGIASVSPEALIADPNIDIVLNLTPPNAHAAVSLAALAAGKHVYSEKPLATLAEDARQIVALAQQKGLAVASAPDTVLGPATRLARSLIEDGSIGRPLLATAAVMGHGMEHWHPNPGFFYQKGGGPVFDVGPYYFASLTTLLGPVDQVSALTQIGNAQRVVTTPGSPVLGSTIVPDTPTTAAALLRHENGVQANVLLSWDVWRHGLPFIEIHGTEGSLRLPDPNWFGGSVLLSRRGEAWEELSTEAQPFGKPNYQNRDLAVANYRGLGLETMAHDIITGAWNGAAATTALHLVEVMEAVLLAGAEERVIQLT